MEARKRSGRVRSTTSSNAYESCSHSSGYRSAASPTIRKILRSLVVHQTTSAMSRDIATTLTEESITDNVYVVTAAPWRCARAPVPPIHKLPSTSLQRHVTPRLENCGCNGVCRSVYPPLPSLTTLKRPPRCIPTHMVPVESIDNVPTGPSKSRPPSNWIGVKSPFLKRRRPDASVPIQSELSFPSSRLRTR